MEAYKADAHIYSLKGVLDEITVLEETKKTIKPSILLITKALNALLFLIRLLVDSMQTIFTE